MHFKTRRLGKDINYPRACCRVVSGRDVVQEYFILRLGHGVMNSSPSGEYLEISLPGIDKTDTTKYFLPNMLPKDKEKWSRVE